MRTATLPNRQNASRRQTPHDLDAIPDFGEALAQFGACDPCDCVGIGTVSECELCGRGAPSLWSFEFPDEAAFVAGEAPESIAGRSLAHATACIWESDLILVTCGSGEDQFGWSLEITGATSGANALTFQQLSGSNCRATKIVYRNVFPWQCLCSNPLLLARDECENVDVSALPCVVCIGIGGGCDLTNWSCEVEDVGEFRTSSEAVWAPGGGCIGISSEFSTGDLCMRESEVVADHYLRVIYDVCNGPFSGFSQSLFAFFLPVAGGPSAATYSVGNVHSFTEPYTLAHSTVFGPTPPWPSTIILNPVA